MREFMKKYGHIWTVLYLPFYLIWFAWLEKTVTTEYTVMHCFIDDYIPFNEFFIIPYFIWFLIVPIMYLYLFFNNKKDFYRFIAFLYGGMTLFLIICTVFPNGQNLRPNFDPNKNVLTKLLDFIYHTDTNTNVFPSIHVYNSIAVMIAVWKNEVLSQKKWLVILSFIVTVSICLSTTYLKQHSILDGLGALVMAGFFYWLVYGRVHAKASVKKKKQKEVNPALEQAL